MTRLANIEKAGYFPLPPTVTDRIISHITAPHGGRLLDPCAGEGAALVALADGLDLEPYGVELHETRAVTARKAVQTCLARRLSATRPAQLPQENRLLHDSYLSLKSPRSGYNLLYLNPPYLRDDEEQGMDESNGRAEYQFLWRTRPYLQPGGLVVYVVPRHILRSRKLADYLAAHFQSVQVYRFPDGEYERFRQIVLFGVQRQRPIAPEMAEVERLRAIGRGETLLDAAELPPLPHLATPPYSLPPLLVRASQFFFRSQYIDPAGALAEARQTGVTTLPAWGQHLDPAAAPVALRRCRCWWARAMGMAASGSRGCLAMGR